MEGNPAIREEEREVIPGDESLIQELEEETGPGGSLNRSNHSFLFFSFQHFSISHISVFQLFSYVIIIPVSLWDGVRYDGGMATPQ